MITLQPSQTFLRDTKNNFFTGLWLFFASLRAFDFIRPSLRQFLFWGVIGGIVNTFFNWLLYGDTGYFNIHGLIGYMLWPILAVFVGIVLAQQQQQFKVMFIPVIFWLVLDFYIVAIQSLIQFLIFKNYLPIVLDEYIFYLFKGLFFWQNIAIIIVLARQLKWRWGTGITTVFATIITLFIWQYSIKNQPIWKVDEVAPSIDEQVFYTQQKLLENALSKIQENNIDEQEWYFLGIAGASYQDVFKSEIEQIQQQFNRDFHTQGRSIALINNATTALSTPFATKTSIEMSLKEIGKKINPEQDILFLYLTSHGIEQQFQLENAPLQLENIDPIWLRKTLDSSGIRWRVIVISACRSGSFIPALQSPDSLIITASASDKDSFGCTNDADFTYFGRAFFNQALREKNTLKDAFIHAQNTVAQWESAQGFVPSEPQWSLGKNMATKLPQFEQVFFPQHRAKPTEDNQ